MIDDELELGYVSEHCFGRYYCPRTLTDSSFVCLLVCSFSLRTLDNSARFVVPPLLFFFLKRYDSSDWYQQFNALFYTTLEYSRSW